jgi:hypothetical protein
MGCGMSWGWNDSPYGDQIGSGYVNTSSSLTFTNVASAIGGALGNSTVQAVLAVAALSYVGSLIDSSLGLSDGGDGYNSPNAGKSVLVNKTSSSEQLYVVYGYRRVGGTRVFIDVDGEYLHIILAMAEGEIESFENIYFADELSTLSKFDGEIAETYTHIGADGQAADSTLMGRIDKWTDEHKLSGVAYIYARLKFDQDVWFGGIPTITADIKGVKVYDPRTTMTTWSDNPALCLRDYMTNARYGRGIPTNQIDDASFIVAANYCDEMVTKGGSSQKRYTCNGVVNIDDPSMTTVKKIMTSCRGMLVFSGGKYKLLIDRDATASFTFNESNIVGDWSISLGNKDSVFSRCKAKIFNKDKSWQDDFITADSQAYRDTENGLMLQRDIMLPFTSDEATAMQIATINMKQSRNSVSCSFTATIEGMRAEVGDVVYLTHATPAWVNKEFRITQISMQGSDEVIISAIEYNATAYDFGTINVSDSAPSTNLPDPSVVLSPIDLSIGEELYYTLSSSGAKARAILSWVNRDTFTQGFDVEYKLAAESVYTSVTSTKNTSAYINDLAVGAYNFRVRATNTSGVRSSWTSANGTLIGLSAPPSDINTFRVRALGSFAHLSWDSVTDLDVIYGGYIIVRHSELLTGAAWEDGQVFSDRLTGSVTDTVVPLKTGTYMVRAVDSSGNYSVNFSSSTTTVKNVNAFNLVESLQEDGGFSGIKDDMVVDGLTLKLSGAPFFVFQEDGFKLLTEDGDELTREVSSTSSVDSHGTYAFSNYIDLLATYTSRVYVEMTAVAFKVSSTFDVRTEDIDTWADFDGTISSDLASAQIEIRTTTDDPNSAPTWTDWQRLVIGDYSARAYDFRLVATSSDADYNVHITKLKAVVDMPDRVETGRNITSGSSAYDVVYGSEFVSLPTVGITANDLGSANHYVVSAESRTGFTINFYNGSGSPIDKNFNFQSIGY